MKDNFRLWGGIMKGPKEAWEDALVAPGVAGACAFWSPGS